MPSPDDDVMRLYDEHAPRLYAVALHILGDRDAAAGVLESVFVDVANGSPGDFASLVRAIRDRALAGRIQPPPAPVVPPEPPTPRTLVEQAFYEGMTVTALAKQYSLSEEVVRSMLRDGMAELRRQFAESGTK
jgi:DNA-directed RNA polymerase specialized sigma24 family protein